MGHVTLRPMTDDEFAGWREHSITSYARDRSRASGTPLEQTLERARTQLAELLPDGPRTAGTWLLTVCDPEGARVGVLWLGRDGDRPNVAFVFDIEIDQAHRGRGLGRATMIAAEGVVRAAGYTEIGLNVFGFNEGARRLYDSLGYRVVSTQMTKVIGAAEPADGIGT